MLKAHIRGDIDKNVEEILLSHPLEYKVLGPGHKRARAGEHLVDYTAERPVVAAFRGWRMCKEGRIEGI